MSKSLNLFSKAVDFYLTKKGLNRSDLARKSGMNPSHISRYLNGNTEPGIGVITRFAEALSVEPWELLKPQDTAQNVALKPISGEPSSLDEEDELPRRSILPRDEALRRLLELIVLADGPALNVLLGLAEGLQPVQYQKASSNHD